MSQESETIIALMAAMKEHGVAELNLETKTMKLTLKGEKAFIAPIEAPHEFSRPASRPEPFSTSQAASAPEPAAAKPEGTPVNSPLVGTYYQAGAPDAPPYVVAGQQVGQGDTLCIIEAMKTMNEIKAPHAGTIVEILGKNGEPVEYGQLLFILRTD